MTCATRASLALNVSSKKIVLEKNSLVLLIPSLRTAQHLIMLSRLRTWLIASSRFTTLILRQPQKLITAPAAIMSNEKNLESIDYRSTSRISNDATASSLRDADEALAFLQNHPQATAITEAGNAILEDPVQLKKLQQKIDRAIVPLLAAIYFLQFLDKTTLAYTAVMGIRKDANLKGQDYSNLSMLFYIGARPPTHSDCLCSATIHDQPWKFCR